MYGNTLSFIVRIWYEETGNEEIAFAPRGSIEHVGGQERLFFSRLEDILCFIEELAGPAPARPDAGNGS